MNIAIEVKPIVDLTASGWAARMFQAKVPVRVNTGRINSRKLSHVVNLDSTRLEIVQGEETSITMLHKDVGPNEVRILNLLAAAGLLSRIGIDGNLGSPIPAFDEDEAARRFWVLAIKAGDEVDVIYSRAREDILRMTVVKNEGGWIRLLPQDKEDAAKNHVIACAVNGQTVPYHAKLVRPGSVYPL
ncbi:hypothetical protein [Noviherbaspirillum galbum]|uniref:Uncharacterized protein n=1 Tax=Noviherbaspirillum galbum TaxID=2709383 RepID=A0A6B3SH41_9BURK|nr:hypothetical protein [Noviherbaspirillum galbum]NEX60164.1 hypothetical protein [Noviherbaspirillum galbum]